MDLWFDELEVGYSVTSEPHLLTKEAIIRFAKEFDPQPFHIDEAAAAETFFGRLIASGAHTYALTMRLGVNVGVFTGKAVAGLGVDDMRFHKPVLPDTFVTSRFTVKALRSSRTKPTLGIVDWQADTFEEAGTRAFSCVIRNLVRRNPETMAEKQDSDRR
jgi:acyl dehydratase